MARRFEGGATGQAPLQIQLSTTASGTGSVALVVGYRATGENALGSTSRPILSRPSTLGVGSTTVSNLRSIPIGLTPACNLLSQFSSAPSLPGVNEGTFNLPLRINWMTNPEDAIVVGTQGAEAGLLLYASASGGHTWTGAIVWEEV